MRECNHENKWVPDLLPIAQAKSCQRCRGVFDDGPPLYRVTTDAMDILVCTPCADAAREFGFPVEVRASASLIPVH